MPFVYTESMIRFYSPYEVHKIGQMGMTNILISGFIPLFVPEGIGVDTRIVIPWQLELAIPT